MVRLRSATADDLAVIMAVEVRAHEYPWSEKVMQRYLLKPGSVWILEEGSTHLGHAVISLVVGEAELLMMTIAPEHQRRGHGRTLLEGVLEQLRCRSAECMFLEVRESNVPAIALYESLGFGENGRRRDYYPASRGGREDALLYSLDLTV